MTLDFNWFEYTCRTKLQTPRAEYLDMTLREFWAFYELYMEEQHGPVEKEMTADELW